MRGLMNAEVMANTMKLKQLGAKIETINSKMSYVRFDIDGVKLEYVYNLNKKGKYFLERTRPYARPLRTFETEEDLVKLIEIDREQFVNMMNSKHADEFFELLKTMTNLVKKVEDLILYYNIPTKDIDILDNEMKKIQNEIDKIKDESERVYFKKDPEHI